MQRGEHDWAISLSYHRCPSCHYLIESRGHYLYKEGRWSKVVSCSRCGESFTVYKVRRLTVTPLLGEATKPEMEWRGR